jgi:hypothetical protein
MTFDREMMAALAADAENDRQDHTPEFLIDCEACGLRRVDRSPAALR